jgi:phage terminase small subunit
LLSDKRAALVDIGKHLGMFKEKVEMTGAEGGPLVISWQNPE